MAYNKKQGVFAHLLPAGADCPEPTLVRGSILARRLWSHGFGSTIDPKTPQAQPFLAWPQPTTRSFFTPAAPRCSKCNKRVHLPFPHVLHGEVRRPGRSNRNSARGTASRSLATATTSRSFFARCGTPLLFPSDFRFNRTSLTLSRNLAFLICRVILAKNKSTIRVYRDGTRIGGSHKDSEGLGHNREDDLNAIGAAPGAARTCVIRL